MRPREYNSCCASYFILFYFFKKCKKELRGSNPDFSSCMGCSFLWYIYIFFSQKFENNVKFLFLILWWIWNQFTILTVILHSFGGEIIWCEDKVITLFFFPKVLKFIIIDVSLNFSWKVWMVIQKNQNSYLLKKTKSLSGCSSSSHVWSAGLDLAVKSLPSWYFAQDCTSYSHSALLSLFPPSM